MQGLKVTVELTKLNLMTNKVAIMRNKVFILDLLYYGHCSSAGHKFLQ